MVMPRRLNYGVGVNDSDYLTQKTVDGKRIICPFFQKWKGMLERCYSRAYTNRTGSVAYKEASVCKEWQKFSAFKAWMESQNWEGLDLDKDMMYPGNKVYSPDTCAFIPRNINVLFRDTRPSKGDYPLGVHRRKPGKDMINDYSKPFVAEGFTAGVNRHLGVYETAHEAHRAWQIGKVDALRSAVSEWRGYGHYNGVIGDSILRVADKIQSDFDLGRETIKYEYALPD